MKTEFIDVSDTHKNLVVEIPSKVVDAEIDKIARDYSKAARIPGFRPGKVPRNVLEAPHQERRGTSARDQRRPGIDRSQAYLSAPCVLGNSGGKHVRVHASRGECLNLLVEKGVRANAIRSVRLGDKVENLQRVTVMRARHRQGSKTGRSK